MARAWIVIGAVSFAAGLALLIAAVVADVRHSRDVKRRRRW